MSQQHSTNSNATTTTTLPAIIAGTEESSAKTTSSSTNSLKKQKKKKEESDEPLTDDFVLMTTPDKFKDKNTNDVNVLKGHHRDVSLNEKVNLDCLLLLDTSVHCAPVHLQIMLKHFDGIQLSQGELTFLLVYIVALESGFVAQSDYEHTKSYLEPLTATSSFHSKNVLRLSHLKPSYNKTEDLRRFSIKLRSLMSIENVSNDYLYGVLIGFITGDFLIITLSPANSTGAKGFSTALSIGRYVLSTQAKNKPLYQRFRKLDELSNILRDKVFVPMRRQQYYWMNCCIYPSLDGMPAELYDQILKNLTKNQLKILANVNKTLYSLTKNSKFRSQNSDANLRRNI